MTTKRGQFTSHFKAKVALETLCGEQTVAELAGQHGIHPNQIAKWQRQATDGLAAVFDGKIIECDRVRDAELKDLHPKIGQLVRTNRDSLPGHRCGAAVRSAGRFPHRCEWQGRVYTRSVGSRDDLGTLRTAWTDGLLPSQVDRLR